MEASKITVVLILVYITNVSHASLATRAGMKHGTLNARPIIGVMAQSTAGLPFNNSGTFYIAASYVKWIESSGARVVPVKDDLTEKEIVRLFHSINGVLLPGGVVDMANSSYASIGRIIFNLAVQANENGDYFPVWGTCLGFQYLAVLTSEDFNIRVRTDAYNLTMPLNFTENYRHSKMFRRMPSKLVKFLGTQPTAINTHHFSVPVSKFNSNERFQEFFNPLSTNYDRKGVNFVSTMEGRKYPFYGTQWHPEKISFEWTLTEAIPHGPESVKVAQYMSNLFVNEARRNGHKFGSVEEENAALMYNYNIFNTVDTFIFDQCYIFD